MLFDLTQESRPVRKIAIENDLRSIATGYRDEANLVPRVNLLDFVPPNPFVGPYPEALFDPEIVHNDRSG
ncbi:MAG TPA: hypothetical protein VGJ21_14545 [Terracidiphilus sp.]